jgi:uncharacterized protein
MKTLILITLVTLVSCGKHIDRNSKPSTVSITNNFDPISENELMISAVINNDILTATSLIRRNVSLESIVNDDQTLLTFSLNQSHFGMAELLITSGAEAGRVDQRGNYPLFIAIEKNNPTIVKSLILYGASINQQNHDGHSPLMKAILLDQVDLANWLVNYGADLTLVDHQGLNAYDHAQSKNFSNLALNIYINSNTQDDELSVHLLTSLFAISDVANIREILNRNPTILQSFHNPSALSLAVQMPDASKALEAVVMILNHNQNPNGSQQESIPPISHAAARGHGEILKRLLTAEAIIQNLDDEAHSPLVHAVKNAQVEAVEILLNAKAPKKYNVTKEGKVIKINSCDIAREARNNAPDNQIKSQVEDIMWELGCGLRWLLFW